MKKIIAAVTLLLLLATPPCLAQDSGEADAVAGACLNGSQWFRLYDTYESDSARLSPMIRCFSKAMLASAFNRQAEAVEAISTLVRTHQQEIGMGNVVSMLQILGKTYSRLGDNAKASGVMKSLADQLEGAADSATVASLRQQERLYSVLSEFDLYQKDDTIALQHTFPFTVDSIGTQPAQVLMHIDSRLNGRRCRMTFDTGATYNVIASNLADKFHLTPTDATISVVGTRLSQGRIAIAKELKIGTLLLRNVPFLVLDLNSGNERISHSTDAYSIILGESLLTQFTRYALDFDSRTVTLFSDTIPSPPSRPNICFAPAGCTPYAEIEFEGNRFAVTLDTGASTTTLGNAFYHDHSDIIAREGKWDIEASTGVGGVTYDSVFRLPSLTMRVAGKPFTMHNVPVSALSTSNALSSDYGRLGLDFFKLWKKVTVDNRAMTIEVE